MDMIRVVVVAWAVIGLAACEGGGVDLNVANTDNSTDNSGGGGGDDDDNPCASYTPAGATEAVQGGFDGTNCVLRLGLRRPDEPALVDLTIPFITGKHVFQDSLFVGEDVDTGARPGGGRRPDAHDRGRQHAGLPGFRRLRADQPRLAHRRQGLAHVADHASRPSPTRSATPRARTTCPSGAASSSTATASPTTAPMPTAPRQPATCCPRASPRTTAATTTRKTPASCAT